MSKKSRVRTQVVQQVVEQPVQPVPEVPEVPQVLNLVHELDHGADAQTVRQQQFLAELGAVNNSYQQWYSRLSADQQQRVRSSTNRFKHGLHAVAPLTCKGPTKCPFITACPIPNITNQGLVTGPESAYPIGLACVLEHEYMAQKIADYVVHLNVDPANPIELAIVNELALIDLKKNRALLILSHGDKDGQGRDLMHVDETIMGFSDNGVPLVSKTTKIHPVADYIDRLERRREKWLDKLMETRKSKADFAIKIGDTDKESKVLQEIQAIRLFVEQMQKEPLLLAADDELGLDDELEDL